MEDGETETNPGRFSSLAFPEYRLLWWGGVFAFLSMQTQQIARAWLAWQLTGTSTALGGVLVGFGVASLFAIPTGGVLADRFPKRTIIVAAQLLQAVSALAIATAVTTDVIAYWMLVVASVVQGAAISLLGPARLAMTADLVDRRHLTNAIFLGQTSLQMTRVIGPALAGTLIGIKTVGIGGVYFISAGLSILALFLTFGLPSGAPTRKSTRSPMHDLQDGLRYAKRNPELLRLLVLSFLVVMFGFPYVTFLPVLVADIFGRDASSLGALTAAAAVGAVVSSITLASADRHRLGLLQTRAGFSFAIFLTIFSFAPTFLTSLLVLFAVGASTAAFQALNNSLVLSIASVEYHGRMQSLIMLSFTGFGLAALPFGIAADAFGLRHTMTAMGVAVLLTMIGSEVWRRRIEKPTIPSI